MTPTIIPIIVLYFGVLFVVAGLWPRKLDFRFEFRLRFQAMPVGWRLELIVIGLLGIALSAALAFVVTLLSIFISEGADKLTSALYNAIGPVGTIIVGLVLAGIIIAILLSRRRSLALRRRF